MTKRRAIILTVMCFPTILTELKDFDFIVIDLEMIILYTIIYLENCTEVDIINIVKRMY